jgi:large subunit ribosomal protein L17
MPYSAVTTKLKRKRNQRRALLKLLAANLILKKRIKTTEAKAKAVRPFVERLLTTAKANTPASRRYIARYLPSKAVKMLSDTIAPEHKDRPGGYTRIIKIGSRKSDSSRIAFIEFVK